MLIGVHGKAGAGKDTLTALLRQELFEWGLSYNQAAFGDAVKEIYCEAKSLTLPELEADKSNHRIGLQTLGQEAREQDENFWVRHLDASIRKTINRTIISDVRYLSEFRYIRAVGGIVIKIEAPFEVRNQRRRIVNDGHISETQLDGLNPEAWAQVFVNDGTVRQLKDRVEDFVADNISRLMG